MSAGPVLRCNDTEDTRARVLDSEELIAYLERRAQQAVDSRDDTSEHLRHVSPCPFRIQLHTIVAPDKGACIAGGMSARLCVEVSVCVIYDVHL